MIDALEFHQTGYDGMHRRAILPYGTVRRDLEMDREKPNFGGEQHSARFRRGRYRTSMICMFWSIAKLG
jgi:hypothetical protein